MSLQKSTNKKDLNVELNLLPVFDILSVCICFLLMTVVWVEVRSIETKQTFGTQSAAESLKGSSLWLRIDQNNNLSITFKNKNGSDKIKSVPQKNGQIDFENAKKTFAEAALDQVTSTQILPSKSTRYEQVIHLMDLAKQAGIINIGLSPI